MQMEAENLRAVKHRLEIYEKGVKESLEEERRKLENWSRNLQEQEKQLREREYVVNARMGD